jgi:hypothetical protein
MSFAVPAPAPRARPSTVSLAVNLFYVAAGIELLNVILGLAYAGALEKGAKKAVEGTAQAGNPTGGVSGAITIVIGLLIVVLLVLLAIFVGRGKQVARVLAWVLGGIALCCTIAVGGLSLAGETFWNQARNNDPSLPTWDRYNELLYSEVPGWYRPVTTILGILLVLAILVPIVLLALPSSHPYFRKVEPEWEPPVPGDPGYPGAPGAPGAPGDYPPGPPPGPPTS